MARHRIDFDWTAAIWEAGEAVEARSRLKDCRRTTKARLKALFVVRSPSLSVGFLRAKCRACGKCNLAPR